MNTIKNEIINNNNHMTLKPHNHIIKQQYQKNTI